MFADFKADFLISQVIFNPNAQTVQFLGGRDEPQSDRGMDDAGMPTAGEEPQLDAWTAWPQRRNNY